MTKKLLTTMTLLLCMCAGAWATSTTIGRTVALSTESTAFTYSNGTATDITVSAATGDKAGSNVAGAKAVYYKSASGVNMNQALCYRSASGLSAYNAEYFGGFTAVIPSGKQFTVSSINVEIAAGNNFSWCVEIVNGSGISLYKSSNYTITNYNKTTATNLDVDIEPASTLTLKGTATVRLHYWLDNASKYLVPLTITLTGEEGDIPAKTQWEQPTFTLGAYNGSTYAVTIDTEEGTTIKYTIGAGEEQTSATNSQVVNVAPETTVTAYATGDGYTDSDEKEYTTPAKPAVATPVVSVASYDYANKGYPITATCETDGATLQYRIGSGSYTTITSGVAFYAVGDGTNATDITVKATKSGYTQSAAYLRKLNAAPSLTSPEKMIPFQASADSPDYQVQHTYRSISFANPDKSVCGIHTNNTTEGLKLRTGQNSNTITFNVNSGYKITNIKILANSNHTDSEKQISLTKIQCDSQSEETLETPVVFPISSSDPAEFDSGEIEATSKIKVTFNNNSASNKQILAVISVTYTAPAVAVSRSVTTKNYTSFCSSQPLDFSTVNTKVQPYIATAAADGKVTLKTVESVPAYTGLVLKWLGDDTNCNVPVGTATSLGETNMLVGTTVATDLKGLTGYNYVLSANEFHPISGSNTTIPANKAYLHSESSAAASARALTIVFDDETTGIHSIDNGKLTIDNDVYDLQGRRVAQPTKGLYIINGKKVVIK